MRVAIYPGSFDPITNGHLDIIERATHFYDEVIIGVAENIKKSPLFSLEERIGLSRKVLAHLKNVKVESFNCLLVEFARKHDAHSIIKGLRAVSDFEHEFQMAQLNRKLDPSIETIFMMAGPEYAYLSSSAVKEIAEYGGCVEGLVPPEVEEGLRRKFSRGREGG